MARRRGGAVPEKGKVASSAIPHWANQTVSDPVAVTKPSWPSFAPAGSAVDLKGILKNGYADESE